ncbi:MAG: hypothetical protein OXU65_03660 [Deltaproteobacteria bacterium]|nr:hypothetical protein [Deltaproteobacteria bacterium]
MALNFGRWRAAAPMQFSNLGVVFGLFEFAPVAALLLGIGRLFALAAFGVFVGFALRLFGALVFLPARRFGFGFGFEQRALLIGFALDKQPRGFVAVVPVAEQAAPAGAAAEQQRHQRRRNHPYRCTSLHSIPPRAVARRPNAPP